MDRRRGATDQFNGRLECPAHNRHADLHDTDGVPHRRVASRTSTKSAPASAGSSNTSRRTSWPADAVEVERELAAVPSPPVKLPTAPVVAVGLIGGYVVARETKIRPLGGAVLAAAGVLAGRQWLRAAGPVGTAALAAVYLGGFGLSHPLAKRIGAWPAVLSAAGLERDIGAARRRPSLSAAASSVVAPAGAATEVDDRQGPGGQVDGGLGVEESVAGVAGR